MTTPITTYQQALEQIEQALETYRCPNCRRILCKGALPPGTRLEVKCKCNETTFIVIAATQ